MPLTQYYVAEDGNDADDGLSTSTPKLTLDAITAKMATDGAGGFLNIFGTMGPLTSWSGISGSAANPIVWRPWVKAGTPTMSHPRFGTISKFVVDGASAVSNLWPTTGRPAYWSIIQGELKGATSQLGNLGSQADIQACHLISPTSGTTVWIVTAYQTRMYGNWFSGGSGLNFNAVCDIQDQFVFNYVDTECTFSSYQFRLLGNACARNVFRIRNAAKYVLHLQTDRAAIRDNTIVGDGTASQGGIAVVSGSDGNAIFNNVFAGLPLGVSNASTVPFYMFGHNAYYNCTSNYSNSQDIIDDHTANDVIETADPFVDAAGGDYMLKSTALSVGAGFSGGDIGAMTAEASSGGLGSKIFGGGILGA